MTDIQKVFLMLNYYDLSSGVFGWFGIFMLDTPCRQEIVSYPPPPQSVRWRILLQHACLVYSLRFPLMPRGGLQNRTGRSTACSYPCLELGSGRGMHLGTGAREHLWAQQHRLVVSGRALCQEGLQWARQTLPCNFTSSLMVSVWLWSSSLPWSVCSIN